MTYSAPVRNGVLLRDHVSCLDLGGRDLTDLLMKRLNENGYPFANHEKLYIDDIRQNMSFVSLNPNSASSTKQIYKLPGILLVILFNIVDDQEIVLGNELFEVSEALFDPKLAGLDTVGIHQLVYNFIEKVEDIELKQKICENIVVAGGNTMLPGFAERINKELKNLAPSNMKIEIGEALDRKYAAWIGSSIFASLYHNQWTTKEEYEEKGANCMNTVK